MDKKSLITENKKQAVLIEKQKYVISKLRSMFTKVGIFVISFALLVIIISISFFSVLNEKTKQIDGLKSENTTLKNGNSGSNKSSCENKNALEKLNIISAYGDNEAYHPKVIYFEKGFNGYKYWMAYSPYPNADSTKENPHIAVSNDLENWTSPEGLDNPLDELPKGYKKNKMYNSDPHILYNSDTKNIEVWWRYVDDTTNKLVIYRRISKDGIHFDDKEEIFIEKRSNIDYLSPTILYEDHKYKMWYVSKNRNIEYMECEEIGNWSETTTLNITYGNDNLRSWHLDVIHTDIGYEMVVVSSLDDNRSQMNLYYSISNDNVNWSEPKLILTPSIATSNWDNKGLYRSSLLKVKNKYYLFYAAFSYNEERGIGLLSGKTINELCYN